MNNIEIILCKLYFVECSKLCQLFNEQTCQCEFCPEGFICCKGKCIKGTMNI